MSSSSDRSRVRHSLVVVFDSPAARGAFKSRIECVRSMLTPEGQPNLDNNGLMAAMFDLVEKFTLLQGNRRASSSTSIRVQSFNRSSGKSMASQAL